MAFVRVSRLLFSTKCRHSSIICNQFVRQMSSMDKSTFSGPEPTELAQAETRSLRSVFHAERNLWKIENAAVEQRIPRETDIAIVGGGLVGLSTAIFLKQRFPRGYSVTVIEKDPSYSHSASALSVSGIRHQFSLSENIQMSLFASEFLRDIREHLSIPDVEIPDVHFNPQGYLLLSSKEDAHAMETDHERQLSLGVSTELMSRKAVEQKFPWLSANDIELASYGLESEGWFDPWLLIVAMKAKLASYDVRFISGEVVGFGWEDEVVASSSGDAKRRYKLTRVHVRTGDNRIHPIQFCVCVNSAGAQSRDIARLAGVGGGDRGLMFDLPIMARQNFMYMFNCMSGPGLNMPMLLDPSGFFVRREGFGGNYICSVIPPLTSAGENDASLNAVEYFENAVRPLLIHRIPAFESLRLTNCWTRQLDYNYFDQCPIIGNHPYHRNLAFTSGSVGHGGLFAPAIGRALMEVITDDSYRALDLSRFSFDRVLDDEPICERLVL